MLCSAQARKARSLGAVTPAAQVAHLAENWDAMTETPLAPIAGLGDEAQIATNLPGYQTQIVFREGDKAVAVLAWSGDPALRGLNRRWRAETRSYH